MQKDLIDSQTLAEVESDDLPVFSDESSWAATPKSGSEYTFGSQDPGQSATIVVVFPFSDNGKKRSHNTVPINVSLTSPPTYEELEDKIVAASEGPLSCLYETSDELDRAAGKFKTSVKDGKGVYFVWDFAPRPHSTVASAHTTPGHATSQASRLTRSEFIECLHAAHAGRISHIIVDAEIGEDKATSVGSEKLNKSPQQNDQRNCGAVKIPAAHGSDLNTPVRVQQQNNKGNGNTVKIPTACVTTPNTAPKTDDRKNAEDLCGGVFICLLLYVFIMCIVSGG